MTGEAGPLRIALRDLVAISTLLSAWVGREPSAIAEGLADVLVATLHLDFVFVRFNQCNGSVAVDAIRGEDRRPFAEWLRRHLTSINRSARRELVVDVGDDTKRYCGFVLPIGFDAATGVIGAATERPGFPSETDKLLLRVATNHAAMAYRSSQLIQDLRRAEDRLRQARDELEVKVRERTSELRRTGAELETILNASPVGMVLVRRDQTVQRCNPAFERLVGWSAQEVVGQRIPLMRAIEERC